MIARAFPAARGRASVRALRPRPRDVLRRYIERDGRNQSELAREAGINHSTVSRILSGSRPLTREVLALLAPVLDLTEDEHDDLLILAGYVPEGLIDDLRLLASLPDKDRAFVRTIAGRMR